MTPQAIRMLGTISFSRRREQGKIPVLGHIPVERIKRIEEDEEKPVSVSV